MDTTKNTHRVGSAAAILIGSAIALVPVTASASQTAATLAVPNGPDIAISAADNLRQAIEADRGTTAPTSTEARTVPLRQLIEADRAAQVPSSAPDLREIPLRQLIEADRPVVVTPQPAPDRRDVPLRQLIEADR